MVWNFHVDLSFRGARFYGRVYRDERCWDFFAPRAFMGVVQGSMVVSIYT